MLLTVLIAGMVVGRLWATPVLALTWAIPVTVTSAPSVETFVSAFASGILVASIGVLMRLAADRLRDPVTARA